MFTVDVKQQYNILKINCSKATKLEQLKLQEYTNVVFLSTSPEFQQMQKLKIAVQCHIHETLCVAMTTFSFLSKYCKYQYRHLDFTNSQRVFFWVLNRLTRFDF